MPQKLDEHNHPHLRTPVPQPLPDARAWLDHIPGNQRGTVANWFHYSARAGAQSPAAVYSSVNAVSPKAPWPHERSADVLSP